MPGSMVGLQTFKFEVAFTGTQGSSTVAMAPNDPTITPIWTDLTHRLTTASTKRGKQYELDSAQASDHTFTLRNTDGAFDPQNTASPFYPFVKPNLPYRLSVIIAGVTYRLSTGVIQAWPRAWNLHGYLDWITADGTDALGALFQIPLLSAYNSIVLAENYLVAYWPLDEATGAASGGNRAQTDAQPMYVSGVNGGVATIGGDTLTGLVGAGGTPGLPNSGTTTGYHFVTSGFEGATAVCQSLVDAPTQAGSAPASSGVQGYSIELWIQNFTTSGTSFLETLNLDGTGWEFNAAPTTGYLTISPVVGGTEGSVLVGTTSVITGTGLHHIVFAVNTGTNTATAYVDGVKAGSASSVGFSAPIQSNSEVVVGIVGNASGTIAQVAIYNQDISNNGATTPAIIENHYQAGISAFPETTGARFTHLLTWGGYTGPTAGPLGSPVPTGDSNVTGACDIDGSSCGQALADLAMTEAGNVFVDNNGNVVFENRHWRMTQAVPAYVFGENVTAGELPYLDDAGVDFDMLQVYNQLEVDRSGGAAVLFQDDVSMKANFPRQFPSNPLTVPLDTDANALALGQYYLYTHKSPRPRLQKVSFNPSQNPALAVFAASVQIGQRVRFNRRVRDSTNPNPFTLELFVESVAHAVDAKSGAWVLTLECTPLNVEAPATGWGMVTAARGTLNAATAASASSFVVNVGVDGAGNTPAQNGWTASGITSIHITDGANSEVLTVSSMTVAAGLVTVHTSTGAAHAHAAGVEVWEADGTATSFNEFDSSAVVGQMAVAY